MVSHKPAMWSTINLPCLKPEGTFPGINDKSCFQRGNHCPEGGKRNYKTSFVSVYLIERSKSKFPDHVLGKPANQHRLTIWSGGTRSWMTEIISWNNSLIPLLTNPSLTLWNCLYKPYAQPARGAQFPFFFSAPFKWLCHTCLPP